MEMAARTQMSNVIEHHSRDFCHLPACAQVQSVGTSQNWNESSAAGGEEVRGMHPVQPGSHLEFGQVPK